MNCKLKKMLALLVALVMLVSSVPLAFAKDAAQTDAAQTETAQTDAAKDDAAKADDVKTDAAKTDDAKADDTKTDGAKTDDAKADDTKTDGAKTDDTKTDGAKTDDAKTDDAKTDGAKTDATPAEKSGDCGEGIVWTLDSKGVLTVSGKGDMKSYEKVEEVPWHADVTAVKGVVLSEGITGVGGNAFNGCVNLETVSLPSTLKTIGDSAFADCEALQELTLPDGLTDILWYAFQGCSSLKAIAFPNSVQTIGASALAECRSLANVTLPDSLRVVEFHLFRMCHSLRSIYIPNSVSQIGGAAFYNCVNLGEITLSRNVTEIGDYAFIGCKSLARVTVYNPNCVLPADSRVFPETTVLCGYKTSTLATFAKENERTFDAMPDIPPHDHIWSEEKVVKQATCLETGILASVCSVCGETKDEKTIPLSDHTPETVPETPATCKKTGLTAGEVCSVCGLELTPRSVLPKTGHTWKDKVTKAKIGSNGKVVSTCTVCKTTKTTKIYKINSVKLSETEITFDGTAKKPTVTVKDSNNKTLKKDTDYKLKYSSGRKNVGIYTVTVTFKGHYSGSKTLKFKIVPGKVTGLKATALSGRRVYVKWDKAKGAKKYVVYYATSKNGAYTKIGTFSGNDLVKSGLSAGRTYYFKVRAVTTVDGTNIFGAYSVVKSAKAKW